MHIAVTGYIPRDVANCLVPLTFSFDHHPEIARIPPPLVLHGRHADSSKLHPELLKGPDDEDDDDDGGDDGGTGDDGGADGGESDFYDLGDTADDLGATNIPANCPPPTNFCPVLSWWTGQHGSVPIRLSGGRYYLPNGAVWTGTEAIYSGINNSGPLEGYIYIGSDGEQWFAGANYASDPESMAVYNANYNTLYDSVWRASCGTG